jgi:hypothetical protein
VFYLKRLIELLSPFIDAIDFNNVKIESINVKGELRFSDFELTTQKYRPQAQQTPIGHK